MASHNHRTTPVIQENDIVPTDYSPAPTRHNKNIIHTMENNNHALEELSIDIPEHKPVNPHSVVNNAHDPSPSHPISDQNSNTSLSNSNDIANANDVSRPMDSNSSARNSASLSEGNINATMGITSRSTRSLAASMNGGTGFHSSGSSTSSQSTLDGFSVASVNDVVLRSIPTRGSRQAMSEFMLTSPRKRSYTVQDAKEQAVIRMQGELQKAQTELKLKDEECDKLSKVRDQMELELEDLTASLFEEANKMVQDAHGRRAAAEKQMQDALAQIEVLQAEVSVFKQLVVTSTPTTPNRHLHPQIDSPTKKKDNKPFWKGHRRSTSHHDFTNESRREAEVRCMERLPTEVDHSCYVEFVSWRENASMDQSYEFLSRIMNEDIVPCLNFANKKLSESLRGSIDTNSLMIEPNPQNTPIPRKCCLTDSPTSCNYKIKLNSESDWLPVSQHCRNRIAAVCDFYTYIRYIVQGLVKCDDKTTYNEVVRLRRQMALARLGYT